MIQNAGQVERNLLQKLNIPNVDLEGVRISEIRFMSLTRDL